ncbi:cupredoxin domain-containing protein [Candidatus Roizmanbacteria bacterium]|nr:cupredoxin domain-containing protein [Candidatus Roizmanbacteria bacterium]
MNNKLGVGLVAAVVLVVGFIMLSNRQVTAPVTQTASSPTTAISPAMTKEDKTVSKVTVTASGFDPAVITVKKGTKVAWFNGSGTIANVSSAKHPTHLVYPKLNLGDFADGQSVSLVFTDAGIFKYHNHLNPSQFGSVTVE